MKELIHAIQKALSQMTTTELWELLKIDSVRFQVSKDRLSNSILKGELKTLETERKDSVDNTIQHNKDMLINNFQIGLDRPIYILGPLLGMPDISLAKSRLRVLIIGPRSEQEIFLYASYGFHMKSIIGLDLIM